VCRLEDLGVASRSSSSRKAEMVGDGGVVRKMGRGGRVGGNSDCYRPRTSLNEFGRSTEDG
jgi:hypothetical protein